MSIQKESKKGPTVIFSGKPRKRYRRHHLRSTRAYEDVKSLRTLVDIVADLVSILQVYLRDSILDRVKRNQYDGTFTGQCRFEQSPH